MKNPISETVNAKLIKFKEVGKGKIPDIKQGTEFNKTLEDSLHKNAINLARQWLPTKEYAAKHNIKVATLHKWFTRGKLEGKIKKCPCGQGYLILDEER